MCGRYTLTELPAEAELVPPPGEAITLTPRYNIAPTNYCPVIPQADPARIYLYKWGLIPHWAKDAKAGYRMINARAESLQEKPAFRGSLPRQRCLVLADGFYEWKATGQGKQPYRITLSTNAPFTFAGLHGRWFDHSGNPIDSFTIITTEPNELMLPIHDRMPVILDEMEGEKWLDPNTPIADALTLLKPYDPLQMKAYPVSPSVGNVKNDHERLILPYSPPPTLF